MSGNSTYEGGVAGNRPVNLTTTGVTTIADGANVNVVKKVYVTEISGNNPTFSLDVYDGTNTCYLMKAKPMTALQTLEWAEIPLGPTQLLRATAGTANRIDVFAVVTERK